MFRGMNLLSACYIAFLSQLLLLRTCHSSNITTPCAASSCGRIQNISHPFRLDTDPQNCGNYNYTLICENNNSTVLYLYSGKYYVQAIDYGNYTIRVVDAGVQDNCCSIPRYSLAPDYFSYGDPYRLYNYKRVLQGVSEVSIDYWPRRSPPTLSQAMVYSNSSLLTPSNYVTDGGMNASDLMELCSIERIFLVPKKNYTDKSFEEIHNDLAYGFELSWFLAKSTPQYFGSFPLLYSRIWIHFICTTSRANMCMWESMCVYISDLQMAKETFISIRYS